MTEAEFKTRINDLQYRGKDESSYNSFVIRNSSSGANSSISTNQIELVSNGEFRFLKKSKLTSSFSISENKYISFNIVASDNNIDESPCLKLGGNIQSLKSYDTAARAYDFYKLFENCTLLKEFENTVETSTGVFENVNILSLKSLAASCYSNMFAGCTGLINLPNLPATTLAKNCYSNMFAGCTSLVNAPELPTVTLQEGCYEGMFKNCSSLSGINNFPVTSIDVKNAFNGMFERMY